MNRKLVAVRCNKVARTLLAESKKVSSVLVLSGRNIKAVSLNGHIVSTAWIEGNGTRPHFETLVERNGELKGTPVWDWGLRDVVNTIEGLL